MERRLLLFIALASMLLAGNAMAATDLSHADTSVQGLLDLVVQQSLTSGQESCTTTL